MAAGGSLFVAVVAAAAAVGAWEFAGLAGRLDARPPLWLLLPLTVWLAIRFAVPGAPPALDIGLGAGLVAGLVGLVVAGSSWRGWMAAMAGAVYVGFSLGFYVALLNWRPADHGFGIAVVAVPVAAVIVCDTGAYLAGSAFGRHRFFPQLSPRKSARGGRRRARWAPSSSPPSWGPGTWASAPGWGPPRGCSSPSSPRRATSPSRRSSARAAPRTRATSSPATAASSIVSTASCWWRRRCTASTGSSRSGEGCAAEGSRRMRP